jgi:N-acetylglucosaminyldiphosphoundecaprenol N-acetyl-beta-D-mannosaminyltransferase
MRTNFMGIPIDILSIEQVKEVVIGAIAARRPLVHCSLNALKVVEARKDPEVSRLLERCDLITPDGMSVIWGLRLLGRIHTERVAGVDVMVHLLREGAKRGWRFFLLGATPEVSELLPAKIGKSFPGVHIVGSQHGYFSPDEEAQVVARIRESSSDVLFVGMPSPRKERFLLNNREALGVPFAMGVGGGLDLLAGKTRRAPLWMRRCGLEWSWRVAQEPRRLVGRYLSTNLRFAALLAGEMLSTRRSRKAPTC